MLKGGKVWSLTIFCKNAASVSVNSTESTPKEKKRKQESDEGEFVTYFFFKKNIYFFLGVNAPNSMHPSGIWC